MASERLACGRCCYLIIPSILCFLAHTASVLGFYLPGSYLHAYPEGSELWVKVNSLTSISTELPYSYYSLPFCKPGDGVKKSAENLGELLMGDQIQSSPYRFRMNKNEKNIFVCSIIPTESDVKHFTQRIDDLYQVNLILDNLPAIRYVYAEGSGSSSFWTGYPIGFYSKNDNTHFLFNHVKFKVLIHDYEDEGIRAVMGTDGFEAIPSGNPKNASGFLVVGFEVQSCSFLHDQASVGKPKMYENLADVGCDMNFAKLQPIKQGEPVTFSYEVVFEKSLIRWPSRWDVYLRTGGARVHWFSILNSLMVICFLAGIVFVIFLRTVRRDLTKYDELDKEAQAQMTEELSGWKLVVGDVFRAPPHSELMCIMVGDGVQITGMGVVTILFAALGFMSPASRGMLLTGMLLLYLFLGIAAGYVACRFWRTLKRGESRGWKSVAWRVACFFPGMAFFVLTLLNFLLWGSKSTGAIPISLFFILLALWFCISVPLTLFGGFLGIRAANIQYPVRTNQIPREIPAQKYHSWWLTVGAGTLPFGTLFIELFFIMSSLWTGRIYYVFGFLFVVLILLVIVCAEVSVVLTYMHLCVEDYRWWWKSFFASGSVALYVFLYSIYYLVFNLHSLNGTISSILYVGYSLIMVLAILLATGTIGLLTSFYFVHYLFSSMKLD